MGNCILLYYIPDRQTRSNICDVYIHMNFCNKQKLRINDFEFFEPGSSMPSIPILLPGLGMLSILGGSIVK